MHAEVMRTSPLLVTSGAKVSVVMRPTIVVGAVRPQEQCCGPSASRLHAPRPPRRDKQSVAPNLEPGRTARIEPHFPLVRRPFAGLTGRTVQSSELSCGRVKAVYRHYSPISGKSR